MYGISVLCSNRFRLCSICHYSSSGSKKLLEILAKMPKVNTARITEAQRQRQNITKKSDKYAPSTVYLQVLGSGARGAPNTLYLFTDQKRYLFNCGECTQRLAHEHKVKLSRLDHIFITSKSWRNIGGLPGLSLTLQDVGVPNITLHGPEGLDELYNATKRFVIMKEMNVTMEKCSPNEDFEDNALTVKYVLLGPHDHLLDPEKPAAKRPRIEQPDKEFEEFVHDDTDYYKSDSKNNNSKDKPRSRSQDKETDKDKRTKSEKVLEYLQKKSHCTVAYICTLKKRPGTLDLAKCVEMGVKPGPMLGQLKNGHDLVLPDGSIVFSKDVKTPDDPGPVFIVMEVPDISYLKDSEFSAHFHNNENPAENIPTLIVHYTPPHVFNHPMYRAFMAMFGPSCRHLVLNAQNSCLGSEAVHRTQHKLHLLDPDIFPMLKDASVPAVWNSSPPPNNDTPTSRGLEDLKNKIALAQFQSIITMEGSKWEGQASGAEGDDSKLEVMAARTLSIFHLRPKRQLDRSAEPKLHIQDYIQETMDVDGFVSSLEQFRRLVDNVRYANTQTQREYPKVVFLGTGSCIPSKTRNTSAIALRIDENRSMLMDCGEGTFGQLVRFYGSKKVNAFLRTLKAIYVSHLHADHHIGLIGVLQARRDAFEQAGVPFEPAWLLAPGQIFSWLSLYDQQFERIKPDFTLIPNQTLLEEPNQPVGELPPAVLAAIGVRSIRTCYVAHCPNAFGVTVDIDGTNKLTYSGDTIPCDALAQIGRDTTLLIHEATMEDELAEEARTKMHSTTTQAIEMGRQMNAKFTVLTHFSQRYARLPRLNANILNDNKTVGIAFDNMQISMSDLELLPHMYAPLQLMFADHCVEMEMKAANRARHRQRHERRASSHDMPHENSTPSGSATPTRRRPMSPGCRAASSLPAPACKYRESNSSRLRQEIKGMKVSGIVHDRSRSNSSSPTNNRSSMPSPARSQKSESGESARRRNSEKMHTSTPRALSQTSQSSSRDALDNSKLSISAPAPAACGYVVDARSKTLNSLNGLEKISKPNKTDSLNNAVPKLGSRTTIMSGYGKPLVTPVNMKLAIRRDLNVHEPPGANIDKAPYVFQAKSQIKTSCKVNHKAPFSTSTKCPYIVKPYQLLSNTIVKTVINSVFVHLIVWRFAHIASCVFIKAWPCALAIIALAIVFWTAIKEPMSRNALRSNVAAPISQREERTVGDKSKNIDKTQKSPSSTATDAHQSRCMKQTRSTDHKAQDIKSPAHRNELKPMKLDAQHSIPRPGQVQHIAPTRASATKIPKKKYSENNINGIPLRNYSTEKLKQQIGRDTSVCAAGRPNSAVHSVSKSFTPQLEDIQSSYLLLNKQQHKQNENRLKAGPENAKVIITPKLKKYNDYERRVQLNEARKKFQSREFLNNSRYDKIEGLNWISWK